ncbi:MAG TPA: ABC transporter substrate-binding protein [Syntrophobacter fumaroxidans]|nr:ABC transporter substrate-binding protein [Syntrophobacter fumaroxidans]
MNRTMSLIGKSLAVLLIGLLVVPAAAWCKEPYKIGGLFSVTGPSSFLGDPEKKSLELAIDEINARGGIDGHLLEAVIYDTEGDPGKTNLNASKLITKDNVIAIIGPSLTPTTLAIVPLAEKQPVPLISCAAGILITEPVKPWVFKTAQNDVLAVAAIYGHMRKKNIKKVGIITVESAYGESGRDQLTAQAPKFGIQVVQAETFGAKDTDMTAQLTKVRSAQPEAVICWGTNPGPAVIARNFQQMGFKIPLYQSHGVASPKFVELAGEAAENIVLPAGKILVTDQLPDSDPQKVVLKRYVEQFTGRFKQPVSPFGGYAYDAMMILAKALEGTEGKKDAVRKRIEEVKGLVGVTGTFNFSPQDHNGLGPDAFVMVQIQNGKFKVIDQ